MKHDACLLKNDEIMAKQWQILQCPVSFSSAAATAAYAHLEVAAAGSWDGVLDGGFGRFSIDFHCCSTVVRLICDCWLAVYRLLWVFLESHCMDAQALLWKRG